jgi:hypothetical protein
MIVIVILLYLRVFVKHFGVCAHKGVATDISVVGCDFGSLCCGYLTTINDCINEVRPKQWGATSCSSTDNRRFSHKKSWHSSVGSGRILCALDGEGG